MKKVWEEIKTVDKKVTRRWVSNLRAKYSALGILGKKKIGRDAFYYMEGSFPPALFWEEILKPFIDEVKTKKGSVSWGSLLIEDGNYYLVFGSRAAILEDGIDITSQLPWEESPRDVLGDILTLMKDIIAQEIKKRLESKVGVPLVEQIGFIKEEFAGKKLAIIFTLDGSSFDVWDRRKMGIFGSSLSILKTARKDTERENKL